MKFLLDVNALVALGFRQHEFHDRTLVWVRTLALNGPPALATCSITELGFIRVLVQAPSYVLSMLQARSLLRQLKSARFWTMTFIPDDHDVSQLPAWVTTGKQTTDGHLAELARDKGAMLATLDARIPGAFLIPA
ncbi:MAG: hypothetical protein ABSD20_14470 [Terriglobales bacterium]